MALKVFKSFSHSSQFPSFQKASEAHTGLVLPCSFSHLQSKPESPRGFQRRRQRAAAADTSQIERILIVLLDLIRLHDSFADVFLIQERTKRMIRQSHRNYLIMLNAASCLKTEVILGQSISNNIRELSFDITYWCHNICNIEFLFFSLL